MGGAYRVCPRAEGGSVTGDGDARDGYIFLWDQLMRAVVLGQVPDADAAAAVAADDLALVRMDHHIINGTTV